MSPLTEANHVERAEQRAIRARAEAAAWRVHARRVLGRPAGDDATSDADLRTYVDERLDAGRRAELEAAEWRACALTWLIEHGAGGAAAAPKTDAVLRERVASLLAARKTTRSDDVTTKDTAAQDAAAWPAGVVARDARGDVLVRTTDDRGIYVNGAALAPWAWPADPAKWDARELPLVAIGTIDVIDGPDLITLAARAARVAAKPCAVQIGDTVDWEDVPDGALVEASGGMGIALRVAPVVDGCVSDLQWVNFGDGDPQWTSYGDGSEANDWRTGDPADRPTSARILALDVPKTTPGYVLRAMAGRARAEAMSAPATPPAPAPARDCGTASRPRKPNMTVQRHCGASLCASTITANGPGLSVLRRWCECTCDDCDRAYNAAGVGGHVSDKAPDVGTGKTLRRSVPATSPGADTVARPPVVVGSRARWEDVPCGGLVKAPSGLVAMRVGRTGRWVAGGPNGPWRGFSERTDGTHQPGLGWAWDDSGPDVIICGLNLFANESPAVLRALVEAQARWLWMTNGAGWVHSLPGNTGHGCPV